MNNTASEHFMVERLILDDLVHWAVNYKVIVYIFTRRGCCCCCYCCCSCLYLHSCSRAYLFPIWYIWF